LSGSSDDFEAPAPFRPLEAAPAAGTSRIGRPLRMLYVEDNRINAMLFENAMQLRASEVELRLAEDGQDALFQLQEWRPDVLVLDSHLPDTDGFRLLEALRRLHGLTEVPAYMCSADASDDDQAQAAAAGFSGYWPKPVNFRQVMAEIDLLLARLQAG
jgi:CheY-like chemotaxis protein